VVQPAQLFSPTIEGTDWITNSSGSFYYTGVPAANNLAASVVPGLASVTDPTGLNEALPGFTTYVNAGSVMYAINQSGENYTVFANTTMASWPSSVTMIGVGVATSGGSITNITQTFGGNLVATGGTTTNPTKILTDSKQTATLSAPWSTAPQALEYMLMSDQTVMVSAELTVPTGIGSNPTTVTTLGSAYWPGRTEHIMAIENAGSPFTAIPHICDVTTAGIIEVYGTLTSGNTLRIFGRYPLWTT
jgi:hypothetical protein